MCGLLQVVLRWITVKLVYAHDGLDFYDSLFVESLKQEYETCVVTFNPNPDQIPKGIPIVRMPDLLPQTGLQQIDTVRKHILTLTRAAAFKKCISRLNADVIIGCWATTYGVYAAFSDHHPFVLFVWGSDVLRFPRFVLFRVLVKYALEKADVVVVDCNFQRETVERLGCRSSKILAFPWYDPSGFATEVKQKSEARAELGLSEDDLVIISTRRHNPIYGVNYLIEAIPLIVRKEPRAKFLILGEGRFTSQFQKRSMKQIDEGSVRFLGNVPHEDVARYLSISDIYVSTSLSDGTSASLLEAMTCSVPPVVTDIPANREWIVEGWNGCLMPTRNVSQLVQKVIWMAEKKETALEIGKNASETIRTKVDWQRSMKTLNDAIMRCYNKVPH
jgi:glycosyltransferase involved in cell wall biosynthesis